MSNTARISEATISYYAHALQRFGWKRRLTSSSDPADVNPPSHIFVHSTKGSKQITVSSRRWIEYCKEATAVIVNNLIQKGAVAQ